MCVHTSVHIHTCVHTGLSYLHACMLTCFAPALISFPFSATTFCSGSSLAGLTTMHCAICRMRAVTICMVCPPANLCMYVRTYVSTQREQGRVRTYNGWTLCLLVLVVYCNSNVCIYTVVFMYAHMYICMD